MLVWEPACRAVWARASKCVRPQPRSIESVHCVPECPQMAVHSRHIPSPHGVRAVNGESEILALLTRTLECVGLRVCELACASQRLSVGPRPRSPRVGALFPRVHLNFIFCLLRPSVHNPWSESRFLLCARAPEGGSSTARIPAQLCVSLKGPVGGPPRASPPHPLATPGL